MALLATVLYTATAWLVFFFLLKLAEVR